MSVVEKYGALCKVLLGCSLEEFGKAVLNAALHFNEATQKLTEFDKAQYKESLTKKYPNKMFWNMYNRKSETMRILNRR